ncbi:MAG: lmo0937 family membrane protein [Nitrososphaerales archaeon]|jgi:hypothetical protein
MSSSNRSGVDLFWTVAIILVVLWLFGFITGFGGALIHLLIVIAVIVVLYRLLTGRNVVTGQPEGKPADK